MEFDEKIYKVGHWDDTATLLDDIAYYLYCKNEIQLELSAIYIQKAFYNSVGSEKYYEKAKILLRKEKINKMRNVKC